MQEKTTRVIRDKRTSRKEHGKVFTRLITLYKKTLNLPPSPPPLLPKRFSVFVRKRPIFPHELKRGEYDIISAYTPSNTLIVHNCKMRADLKIKNSFIENNIIKGFSGTFSEKCDNDYVYKRSVMQLVQYVLSGKKGVLFMFGQTGSGKTYTIMSSLNKVGRDVFCYVGMCERGEYEVVVSCFEMTGDKCCDLLNKRGKLVLRTDSSGDINVCGINKVKVNDVGELLEIVEKSFKNRKTCKTKVNSVSSRSHCIFKIQLLNSRDQSMFGEISLVDLAGSERNEDTFYHSAQRIVESCKINSSLMALKECIRAYNKKSTHIPYRNDRLTQYLKDCFLPKKEDRPEVRTVVITCVSPSPTDTEHTLSSLKNTSLMCKKSSIDIDIINVSELFDNKNKKVIVHPQKWTVEETFKWISTINNGKYKKYVNNFPSQMDGKQICRYSKKRFAQICNGKDKVGEGIRELLLLEMKKFVDMKNKRAKENRALVKGQSMF